MEKKNRLESEIRTILRTQSVSEHSLDIQRLIFRLRRITASADVHQQAEWATFIEEHYIYKDLILPAVAYNTENAKLFMKIIEPLVKAYDDLEKSEVTRISSFSNDLRIIQINDVKFRLSIEAIDQIRCEAAEAILFFERNKTRVAKINP